MIIEDEELRTLYQSTCQGRLSALRSETNLDALRREAHSLKGDSRVMGRDEIAETAQQIARGIKHQRLQVSNDELTADSLASFQQLLAPALSAIEQRVCEATDLAATRTSQPAEAQQVIDQLQAAFSGGQASEHQVSEHQISEGQISEGQISEGQISDGRDTPVSAVPAQSQGADSYPNSEEVADVSALTSAFIDDADLRSLYRTTATQRLSALKQSLEQLGKMAQNSAAPEVSPGVSSEISREGPLATLRYESQGLKGDSLAASQGAIAALSEKVEWVANQLFAPHVVLTEALQAELWQSIQLIERLIQQAINESAAAAFLDSDRLTVGVATHLSSLANNIIHQLSAFNEAGSLLGTDELGASELSADEPVELIEDVELRDIYRTTSEERLYRLETAFSQIELVSQNPALILDMVREAHSLKGDAQSIQITSIAEIAASLETLLVSLQNKLDTLLQNQVNQPASQLADQRDPSPEAIVHEAFSPEVLDVCRESLRDMSALIQTVTVGSPNRINVSQLTQNLQALTALTQETTPTLPMSSAQENSADSSRNPGSGEEALDVAALLDTRSVPMVTTSRIEDDELRTVYRTVSEERLQRLEKGLAQLSSEPDNRDITRDITAGLLREAHSLKGDARSVGLDEIEQLSHATEDILIGIQQQPVILTGELSELLLRGLDAIAQLIDEAVIGRAPSQVETSALVSELRAVELPEIADLPDAQISEAILGAGAEDILVDSFAVERAALETTSPEMALLETSEPAFFQPIEAPAQAGSAADDRLETIRIQARDLDTLAAQTEQLTLTRIQTAQATAKVTELVALWGKWRSHQKSQQASIQAGERPSSGNPFDLEIETLINQLRLETQENSFRLELLSQDLSQQVQNLRLLPVSTVLRSLPRTVRNLARQQSKSVELIIEGEETTADKRILEDIQDSLQQLVRNAIDHGIESPEERESAGKSPSATLWIRSYQSPNNIVIEVADDGRGLDLEQIRQTAIRRKLYDSNELNNFSEKQLQELVFVPGFSTRSFTTEISGRGVGLDVVRNQVERLKGNVQIESEPGKGCTFRLQIRTQLATANVVFVSVRGIIHAIPIEFLQTTMRLSDGDIVQADGRETITWNQQAVPIRDLFEVLELANSPAYVSASRPTEIQKRACLVLKSGDDVGAILVDRLLDTQEVIFKPQSALLKRVRNVVGATILGDGEICSILNPPDLIKSVQRADDTNTVQFREPPRASKPLLLLVEDSPPVRIQEKRLFETAGYEVVTAEDGVKGYEILRAGNFDAVVSDIEMPNLDGLSLTAKIREHSEYKELPIILVTTLSSEQDRRRGADMGANAYIVKGKFNQEVLLETLNRLI